MRNERTEGRDWTQYVIVNDDVRTEPLRKRWAVLRLLQAVHAAGVPAHTIRATITGPRFLPVDGTLTGDELKSAFVTAYPKAADRLGRWFFDDPIHDADRTWVLSTQWGGDNAIRTLDALVTMSPSTARISYGPA